MNGMWKCVCGWFNFDGFNECYKCKKQKGYIDVSKSCNMPDFMKDLFGGFNK